MAGLLRVVVTLLRYLLVFLLLPVVVLIAIYRTLTGKRDEPAAPAGPARPLSLKGVFGEVAERTLDDYELSIRDEETVVLDLDPGKAHAAGEREA